MAARDETLDNLLNGQRRLVAAGAALRRSVAAQGAPTLADRRTARLIAADLGQTLKALEEMRATTAAAAGRAAAGRAASLAYLAVGRAARR
jgi:hypothetical protein